MSNEQSVRQMAEEWNAKAKAEGRLLEHDPWSLPSLCDGSILDVPLTPEAEERIQRLDALIARLERQKAAVVAAEQRGVRDRGEENTGPVSVSATNNEAPTSTTAS